MGSSDGWETLLVKFDHPEEAVFVALGMGAKAEVLAPENVRERVAQEIRGMAERIRG
jgi:predicted DNA-binding transcriptional regulator YafY